MRVLVTGGAGYIGSITVKRLLEKGHDVVVFDNLVYGHKEAVPCELVTGDLLDKKFLFESFKDKQFDAVIHFAAYALAGDSMEHPDKYFSGNIQGGLHLLELMRELKISNMIFSSTCAIYGAPQKLPVTESEKKKPESVYGESKLIFETILDWYSKLYPIKHINLRYFNACGAALDGSLGEDHDPETHIIPVAINAVLNNKPFKLFGNDYLTDDGTCIRDYIHVEDLAIAHIQALEKLSEGGENNSYNLGTGNGYSNLQILDMIKKVSGKDLKVEINPRRQGDPPAIYADNTKAKQELGFNPRHSDLETIIKTAWEWHEKNSKLKMQNSK